MMSTSWSSRAAAVTLCYFFCEVILEETKYSCNKEPPTCTIGDRADRTAENICNSHAGSADDSDSGARSIGIFETEDIGYFILDSLPRASKRGKNFCETFFESKSLMTMAMSIRMMG
jgi:hypothetical protein